MMKMLFLIFTIALVVVLVMWVGPSVKMALEVIGIKKELKRFKRNWIDVQRRFDKDEVFRQHFTSSPEKFACFLSITDQLFGTNYSEGLEVGDLENKFKRDPDSMQRSIRNYLCTR